MFLRNLIIYEVLKTLNIIVYFSFLKTTKGENLAFSKAWFSPSRKNKPNSTLKRNSTKSEF